MIIFDDLNCKIIMGTGDVKMTPGIYEGKAALSLNNQCGHKVGDKVPNDIVDAHDYFNDSKILLTASDQKSVLVLIESLMSAYIMAELGEYPGDVMSYENRLLGIKNLILRMYKPVNMACSNFITKNEDGNPLREFLGEKVLEDTRKELDKRVRGEQ